MSLSTASERLINGPMRWVREFLTRAWRISYDAYLHFVDDDGWAIAGHIAFSALLALFPFMIFVTSLAAVFGSKELAEETMRIVLETWPKEVATPLANEIHDVLTHLRTDVLTVSVALAVFFSSSGIESLRIGLNRAYGMKERRYWWWLRLESIGYVLVGAVGMLALSFLVLLYPLMWATALRYLPAIAQFAWIADFVRFAAAALVLIVALVVVHMWLPAGRRRLIEVAPGILVTLALWLACAIAFGRYLVEFAQTYVVTYAGLASVVIALVFLYWVATIFVYGGEFNAAIARHRAGARKNVRHARPPKTSP